MKTHSAWGLASSGVFETFKYSILSCLQWAQYGTGHNSSGSKPWARKFGNWWMAFQTVLWTAASMHIRKARLLVVSDFIGCCSKPWLWYFPRQIKTVLERYQLLSGTDSCCLCHFGRSDKALNAELCLLDVACGAELVWCSMWLLQWCRKSFYNFKLWSDERTASIFLKVVLSRLNVLACNLH